MPVISGKRAFLELLKQEGVDVLFGNPGTTELPLMDALAVDNDMRYVLGLQEAAVMAMADGYAQASGKLAVVNLHVTPGLGNAMGMLYDAQKRHAAPRHRRPARPGFQPHRADPLRRADADRAAAGEMVGRGASPAGPADAGASRLQDRARAADRAGVPVAAGRHPEERGRSRPDGADARRAEHARRPRRHRGGREDPRRGETPGDHGGRCGSAEPRARRAGRAGRADRRAGLCRADRQYGVVPLLAPAVPWRDGALADRDAQDLRSA